MSLTAVARETGTTRQALYRRWPTKASLASAALHGTADLGPAPGSEDPLTDLAAELADFQRGVSRPGGSHSRARCCKTARNRKSSAVTGRESSPPAAAASAPSSTGRASSA